LDDDNQLLKDWGRNPPFPFLKGIAMAKEDKKNPKDSKNESFGESRLKHIEKTKEKK